MEALFSFPAIDLEIDLEISPFLAGIEEVADGRAATFDGLAKNPANLNH